MAGRKPTVSDRDILSIIDGTSDPAVSTGEVADAMEMSQPGAYSRLSDLVDEGLVGTKKFGQGRGWWLTDEGLAYLKSNDT